MADIQKIYDLIGIENFEPRDENEPTQEDRIEAQVMYTALMTDTLLTEE